MVFLYLIYHVWKYPDCDWSGYEAATLLIGTSQNVQIGINTKGLSGALGINAVSLQRFVKDLRF